MIYFMSETDLISLQLLLVLNLANIFIMFFMFFLLVDRNNNRRVLIPREIRNENLLGRYEINFDDVLNIIYSDTFPYEEKCSICLENFVFSDDKPIIETNECNHYFHETCIKQWLRIRPSCPNCQTNLVARYIEHNN